MSNPIYLDYHATTPLDPRIMDTMLHYMAKEFGNASSVDHIYGDQAEKAVKEASRHVCNLLDASRQEVIFTSGATESINLAIHGFTLKQYEKNKKIKIALLPIEHKAVLDTCLHLQEKKLAELIFLKIDSRGRLDLDDLESICKQGIHLLCVMAANNEIGNIYPVETIASIAQKYEVPFFSDASQVAGKIPIAFQKWGITFLAISAHKMYGPKGSGALIIKKGTNISPIMYGGEHQYGLRPGTLNVPGIVGLGEACRLRRDEMVKDEKEIDKKRDRLQQAISEAFSDVVINGDIASRLSGNLHLSIPGIPNTAIIARIRDKLAISSSSACTSGTLGHSHVLRALGLSEEIMEGSLRIGIGKFTTDEEITAAIGILISAIRATKTAFSSIPPS